MINKPLPERVHVLLPTGETPAGRGHSLQEVGAEVQRTMPPPLSLR